jgi:hypothetical protein
MSWLDTLIHSSTINNPVGAVVYDLFALLPMLVLAYNALSDEDGSSFTVDFNKKALSALPAFVKPACAVVSDFGESHMYQFATVNSGPLQMEMSRCFPNATVPDLEAMCTADEGSSKMVFFIGAAALAGIAVQALFQRCGAPSAPPGERERLIRQQVARDGMRLSPVQQVTTTRQKVAFGFRAMLTSFVFRYLAVEFNDRKDHVSDLGKMCLTEIKACAYCVATLLSGSLDLSGMPSVAGVDTMNYSKQYAALIGIPLFFGVSLVAAGVGRAVIARCKTAFFAPDSATASTRGPAVGGDGNASVLDYVDTGYGL